MSSYPKGSRVHGHIVNNLDDSYTLIQNMLLHPKGSRVRVRILGLLCRLGQAMLARPVQTSCHCSIFTRCHTPSTPIFMGVL